MRSWSRLANAVLAAPKADEAAEGAEAKGFVSRMRSRPEPFVSLIVLVLVLFLWEAIATSGILPRIILPPASAVLSGLVRLVTAEYFPPHIAHTVTEVVIGFAIGTSSSFSLAVLLHHLPFWRRVLYPYIITFQLTPSVVLAPLFVIWFGFGIESKIVVSATTSFFVVLISTLAGLDAVPTNARLLMESMCASKRQLFFMLTLPNSLPYVFAGLKTATTMAMIGALVGEFITARFGLGVLLTQFSFALKQDLLFATVITIVALGIVAFGAVELVQRKIVWWRH